MTAYRNPDSEVAHNFPSRPYRGTVIEDLIDHVDRVVKPSAPPVVEHNPSPTEPPKFNAAFIDRRMREHREWQRLTAARLGAEVVSEVAGAIDYVQQMHRRPRLK